MSAARRKPPPLTRRKRAVFTVALVAVALGAGLVGGYALAVQHYRVPLQVPAQVWPLHPVERWT